MIGHGTSGEVRRAINRQTGKEVAVKVCSSLLLPFSPPFPDTLGLFRQAGGAFCCRFLYIFLLPPGCVIFCVCLDHFSFKGVFVSQMFQANVFQPPYSQRYPCKG